MTTFYSFDPTTIMVVLLNLLFWVGIGFLVYYFFSKKKK